MLKNINPNKKSYPPTCTLRQHEQNGIDTNMKVHVIL